MTDTCHFPRCKQIASINYIQRNLCEHHWLQICEADSKTEKKLLKRILLARIDGNVVQITKNKPKRDRGK